MDDNNFDVIIVGGGAAGLSAAVTLSRARRSVLVLDDDHPRNAPAAGVHGFLSRDGMAPADLVDAGAAEVSSYGGKIIHSKAIAARENEHGFAVDAADGRLFTARRLLITTGLVDELPDIPGLRERWGHDVLHCPYCHGWEVRDQPIGVLGAGPHAARQALMFRQWSADVTLFLHTGPSLTDDQREQLDARGIAVVEGEVASLEVTDDRLAGVRLASGRVVARRALVVAPKFVARNEIATGLGLTTTVHPMGVGHYLESDSTGRSAVPGVWVAGNATDLAAQVVVAAAGGVTAAAAMNADLIEEDTRLAVERRREPFSAVSEFANCHRILGDRRHGLIADERVPEPSE